MNRICSILILFGVLVTVDAAQAQETRVKANIPFPFIVNKQLLPAGEYSISTGSHTERMILLRSEKGKAGMYTPTNACETVEASGDTKLVFHAMAGRYFLYQIWRKGDNRGLQLPLSPAEIELAQNSRRDLDRPAEVIVAATLVP